VADVGVAVRWVLAGLAALVLLSGCRALRGVESEPPDYVKKYQAKDPAE
jgi:hypothetical protein